MKQFQKESNILVKEIDSFFLYSFSEKTSCYKMKKVMREIAKSEKENV